MPLRGVGSASPVSVAASGRAVAAPLDLAMNEPCVKTWLSEVNPESRPAYKSSFRLWILWLWQIPEWAGKMPSELLDLQEDAIGRQRRRLPKLILEHAQQTGGTYKSMTTRVSRLRSFFLHNSVELPSQYWQPRPTREPVRGKLTFEQVRNIIVHADPRNTAIFLTMLQGLMDLERFKRFNQKYAIPLVKHLREKTLDDPFRIDFLGGRKRNPRPFYTFIYRDSLAAWSNYFTHERGWPEQEGEALALTDQGTPPDKPGIRAAFRTIAERLHYRPETPKGRMSGVAPHEAFRDVVRSHLRIAKKDGFDLTCAEFWMGHSIDPYNYEKFTDLEPEYMLANAKIAARYLNIISNPTQSQEPEGLLERIEQLEFAIKMLEGTTKYRVQTVKPVTGGETKK